MIVVVDYGVGNVASVINMLKKVGAIGIPSGDPKEIAGASKIILPGVGAFDTAMQVLQDRQLVDPIADAVRAGSWLLGICLGAQLLLEGSEEGIMPGLGLIKGRVRKFDKAMGLRIPHMGWNVIKPVRSSRLFRMDDPESRFYFVHSYYIDCQHSEDVSALCSYGVDFACAVESERVLGVQFHPEKSHRFGMNLFKRFVESEC